MTGVREQIEMRHAFYCRDGASLRQLKYAFERTREIRFLPLGDIRDVEQRTRVADFTAFMVARDGVIGIYQGNADRPCHRSMVANPCNPRTLDSMSRLVELSEQARPLVPMATLEAALQLFEPEPAAQMDHYNALNYMVLAARAREEAYAVVPAAVHQDGRTRVQIVSPDLDPFAHTFLQAMGRRVGIEMAVSASLNVGSLIVKTPTQALNALKRSNVLKGLLIISDQGESFFAWHDVIQAPKGAGRTILRWLRDWEDDPIRAA